MWDASRILSALDACADDFSFPMLDNGYVYPAATRLTVFRSLADWALALEVFGFNPRAGFPETTVYTFGSRVVRQRVPADFVRADAFERYVERNRFNEQYTSFALDDGPWRDSDDAERLREGATFVVIRGERVQLPDAAAYAHCGVELSSPPRVAVFEMCRWLASTHRTKVLATVAELRAAVPRELTTILTLDEWHHPDLAAGERPGQAEAFRQLASVLESGDVRLYSPTESPNTHWSNWPTGGTL